MMKFQIQNCHSNIKEPKHYQLENGKKSIELLKDLLGDQEYKGYCKGNVIKYIIRYEKKNKVEDLKKAIQYINFLIEVEENETR